MPAKGERVLAGVSCRRILVLILMVPLALADVACGFISTPMPPPSSTQRGREGFRGEIPTIPPSSTPIPEPVYLISFSIIGEAPVLAPHQPIQVGPAQIVVRELRREPDGGLRIQGVIEPTGATPESGFNPLFLSVGREAGLAWAALAPSQDLEGRGRLYARRLEMCVLWSEEPPIATRTFSCQWPGNAGPFLGVGLFAIRRGGSLLIPIIPLQDEDLRAVLLAPNGPAPSAWRGRLPWMAAGVGETVMVDGLAVTLLDVDWALGAKEPGVQISLALACQGQDPCDFPSVVIRDQQRMWFMEYDRPPDQPVSGLIPPGAEVQTVWRTPSSLELLPNPNEAVIVVGVSLRREEGGDVVENIYLRPVP